MTCLLNTFTGLYPALKECVNEAGRAVADACSVTLPSSWNLAATIVLEGLVEKRQLAVWSALKVNEELRIVTFDCRPPFLSRSHLATVAVIVPEDLGIL